MKKFLLLVIILFSNIDDALSTKQLKYINIVIEDTLFYPMNNIINQFALKNDLIINTKYVKRDFFEEMNANENKNKNIDLIITQSKNKEYIKQNFDIQKSILLGYTSYCLCIHSESKIIHKSTSSIQDILKQNKFNNISMGSNLSNFFIGELKNIKSISIYDSADEAIQSLYFQRNTLGLLLYPMCIKDKKLKILYILTPYDVFYNNLDKINVEYNIYLTNHINKNIENFLLFLNNDQDVIDLLKNFGILKVSRIET